jgi:hypothetical protein
MGKARDQPWFVREAGFWRARSVSTIGPGPIESNRTVNQTWSRRYVIQITFHFGELQKLLDLAAHLMYGHDRRPTDGV